jgi:thiol:disulfide interchange protein DsbC
LALMSAATISSAAPAATSPIEDTIKANIQPLFEGMKIEKIDFSQRLGLYEVITSGGIFYTDKTGSYVVFGGTVVDSKTKDNLTQARADALGAFEFSKLPFADAIKTVHGNGLRKLATFEDPNCGFCKKLAPELEKLKNVTIYTFMTPILSPDSTVKSRGVWCSADKSKTWSNFMLKNIQIPDVGNCETPLERNAILQQKLRINGTPAILFASNARIPGYTTSEKIEDKLSVKPAK